MRVYERTLDVRITHLPTDKTAMFSKRIVPIQNESPTQEAHTFALPSNHMLRLIERNNLQPFGELRHVPGMGTSTHIVLREGERIVLKACCVDDGDFKGQREIGRASLEREEAVLRLSLPGLPEYMGTLRDATGHIEGVLRRFYPGSPVAAQVQQGYLSEKDFMRALAALLKNAEERGLVLSDPDISNFIVAAEDGIVNSNAVHRTLMLIDPEALSPRGQTVQISGYEPTRDVRASLTNAVRALCADRRAA